MFRVYLKWSQSQFGCGVKNMHFQEHICNYKPCSGYDDSLKKMDFKEIHKLYNTDAFNAMIDYVCLCSIIFVLVCFPKLITPGKNQN